MRPKEATLSTLTAAQKAMLAALLTEMTAETPAKPAPAKAKKPQPKPASKIDNHELARMMRQREVSVNEHWREVKALIASGMAAWDAIGTFVREPKHAGKPSMKAESGIGRHAKGANPEPKAEPKPKAKAKAKPAKPTRTFDCCECGTPVTTTRVNQKRCHECSKAASQAVTNLIQARAARKAASA